MSISALLHSILLSFKHLTPVAHLAHEGITRIKAGKYTKKIWISKVFTLIFKHLRVVYFTQQMLAHQSLPTLQHEKPCFDAQKVKRQEMYISTSSPRTTPHIWVVGTITQLIAAVTIVPRRYTLRHTTSCMRFSSSTSPFLTPHSTEVTAHAALFPTLRNIILGLCTHIRRTLLVTHAVSQPPHHPGTKQ